MMASTAPASTSASTSGTSGGSEQTRRDLGEQARQAYSSGNSALGWALERAALLLDDVPSEASVPAGTGEDGGQSSSPAGNQGVSGQDGGPDTSLIESDNFDFLTASFANNRAGVSHGASEFASDHAIRFNGQPCATGAGPDGDGHALAGHDLPGQEVDSGADLDLMNLLGLGYDQNMAADPGTVNMGAILLPGNNAGMLGAATATTAGESLCLQSRSGEAAMDLNNVAATAHQAGPAQQGFLGQMAGSSSSSSSSSSFPASGLEEIQHFLYQTDPSGIGGGGLAGNDGQSVDPRLLQLSTDFVATGAGASGEQDVGQWQTVLPFGGSGQYGFQPPSGLSGVPQQNTAMTAGLAGMAIDNPGLQIPGPVGVPALGSYQQQVLVATGPSFTIGDPSGMEAGGMFWDFASMPFRNGGEGHAMEIATQSNAYGVHVPAMNDQPMLMTDAGTQQAIAPGLGAQTSPTQAVKTNPRKRTRAQAEDRSSQDSPPNKRVARRRGGKAETAETPAAAAQFVRQGSSESPDDDDDVDDEKKAGWSARDKGKGRAISSSPYPDLGLPVPGPSRPVTQLAVRLPPALPARRGEETRLHTFSKPDWFPPYARREMRLATDDMSREEKDAIKKYNKEVDTENRSEDRMRNNIASQKTRLKGYLHLAHFENVVNGLHWNEGVWRARYEHVLETVRRRMGDDFVRDEVLLGAGAGDSNNNNNNNNNKNSSSSSSRCGKANSCAVAMALPLYIREGGPLGLEHDMLQQKKKLREAYDKNEVGVHGQEVVDNCEKVLGLDLAELPAGEKELGPEDPGCEGGRKTCIGHIVNPNLAQLRNTVTVRRLFAEHSTS